jgi:hypothetical protein
MSFLVAEVTCNIRCVRGSTGRGGKRLSRLHGELQAGCRTATLEVRRNTLEAFALEAFALSFAFAHALSAFATTFTVLAFALAIAFTFAMCSEARRLVATVFSTWKSLAQLRKYLMMRVLEDGL